MNNNNQSRIVYAWLFDFACWLLIAVLLNISYAWAEEPPESVDPLINQEGAVSQPSDIAIDNLNDAADDAETEHQAAEDFSNAAPDASSARPRDFKAPTTPQGLTATVVSSSQINLSWQASTDNIGVAGYKVFRSGAQIATMTSPSYSSTGLSPATAYSYAVSAYDAAGNASAKSTSVSATTQTEKDIKPPTAPSGLTATVVSSSRIDLAWTVPTDNVAVTGYQVFQNDILVATVTDTTYSSTGLSPATTYSYAVSAYDAAGNTSVKSDAVRATTQDSGYSDGGAPAGIYAIDLVVDKPFVDGVLIRLYWDQIEITEGTYDFSKADSIMNQAKALDKSVTMAVMAMATPLWLESKSETFNHPQFGVSIAPWDDTMLTALEKLIAAISNHQFDGTALKDNPMVKQVDAAIGGIQSIRLTQLPSGYSAEKLEEGVFRSVRAWANAFPDKHLYVGLFNVADGATNPRTAESLRDKLLAEFNGVSAPRVNFFQEVLTGFAPSGLLGDILGAVKNETGIMLQACGEWSNQPSWPKCYWLADDTPDAGFSLGYNNFNATYFEIYEADLLNDAYAGQFQQWHDTLLPYIQ